MPMNQLQTKTDSFVETIICTAMFVETKLWTIGQNYDTRLP